jgi:D-tyrosyl-tRNA(Tyr) deacylase
LIALLQRVTQARVAVGARVIAEIGSGLLVLIGIRRGDTAREAERLLERILDYRVFADADGRMNLSVRAVGGALLLVPQFTLAADTRTGTRASFGRAAPPDAAAPLFSQLLALARAAHSPVATGEFGAAMQVSLVNDGPVTFWLEVAASGPGPVAPAPAGG